MAQIESKSPGTCEPPWDLSRSSLFFIGTDRRGNWVVRDQAGYVVVFLSTVPKRSASPC